MKFGLITIEDRSPLIFTLLLSNFRIPLPFLPVFIPQQWLLQSHPSTEKISGEASVKSKNQVYLSGPVSGVFRGFSDFLRISLSDTVHCLQIAFRPVTTPNTFSYSRRVYFPNETL